MRLTISNNWIHGMAWFFLKLSASYQYSNSDYHFPSCLKDSRKHIQSCHFLPSQTEAILTCDKFSRLHTSSTNCPNGCCILTCDKFSRLHTFSTNCRNSCCILITWTDIFPSFQSLKTYRRLGWSGIPGHGAELGQHLQWKVKAPVSRLRRPWLENWMLVLLPMCLQSWWDFASLSRIGPCSII